ncbi:MAG TPA: hypothetical protein VD859_17780 [Nocardioides sp.]|nr:hypothetical protein [Nocardioides sp.]
MKVQHEGTTWRVSRRWVPWRRRLRTIDAPDVGSGVTLGDDPISAIVGIVLLVVLLPFLLVALFVLLEVLLLLLLVPIAALVRIVFGRHWVVEVRRGWTAFYEEQAGDWRDSGERIHLVAQAIERGQLPPQNIGTPPAATEPVDPPA